MNNLTSVRQNTLNSKIENWSIQTWLSPHFIKHIHNIGPEHPKQNDNRIESISRKDSSCHLPPCLRVEGRLRKRHIRSRQHESRKDTTATSLRASPKTGLSTLFTRRATSSSSSSAQEVSMNSGSDGAKLCECVWWESLCVSGGLPFCGHPSEDYLSFLPPSHQQHPIASYRAALGPSLINCPFVWKSPLLTKRSVGCWFCFCCCRRRCGMRAPGWGLDMFDKGKSIDGRVADRRR